MSRVHLAPVLGLAVASLLLAVVPGPATAASGDCAGMVTTLLQVDRKATSSSLVTTSAAEAAQAGSAYHFSAPVAVAAVATSPGTELVAVRRLQKDADYLVAVGDADIASAEGAGYTASGATFYAMSVDSRLPPCVVPAFQLTRQGHHRVAVGTAARDGLVAGGWSATAPFAYVGPVVSSASTPTPAPTPTATPTPTAAPTTSSTAQPVPTGPVAAPASGSDTDTRFTIAVLPDTQRETHSASDPRLRERSVWLATNKAKLDLRFAVHVGDVADWDTPDHAQYANAARGLLPLEAAVPWAVAPGNHDTGAVCVGGSACPGQDASVAVRDTKTFNTYFPRSRFSALSGQFEAGKVDNAYYSFRAGGKDWTVLTLELWPRTAVVDWAAKVIAANPRRNVVVVTHSYLTRWGTISTSDGGYGVTSPSTLYSRLVRPNPNVKLVLSGHVGTGAVRTDTTAAKTKVVSMLSCFHSDDDDPVRLITVDTKTGTFTTWVYSPHSGTMSTEFSKTVTGLTFVG